MIEFLQANPWMIGVFVVLALVLAWWIFVRNRKTRVVTTRPDVLDEGAAPAKRNQALIDAPSAAATPGSVLGTAPAPKPEPVITPAPPPVPKPKAVPAPKPKAAPKPKTAPKPKAEPKPKAVPEAKAKPAPKPKAVPKPKPESVTASAPAPTPPPPAPTLDPKTVTPDELTQIKGLGPKMAGLLSELGVTSFAQVAAWTDVDIARIDPQLGNFAGRIERDNFVEQAKLLAASDIAGFEAKFGAL